ncbi:MAG: mechanosensitive ion channel family protein [Armatimonadota bacterium]
MRLQKEQEGHGRKHRGKQKWLPAALVPLAIFFCFGSTAATAQLPGLEAPRNPVPASVKRSGLVETTEVTFEGLPLFTVAAPYVEDRGKPGAVIPVEDRAQDVERRLQKLLEALAATDKGTSESDKTSLETGDDKIVLVINGVTVMLVAEGQSLSPPRELVQVTPLDAEQEQMPPGDLAQQWRTKIVTKLSDAIRERRPDAVKDRLRTAWGIAGIVPFVTLLLLGAGHLLYRRQERLRKAIADHNAADAEAEATRSAATTTSPGVAAETETAETAETAKQEAWWRFHQTVSLENQFRVLAFFRWLVLWGLCALWLGGIALGMFLFPATRHFGAYLLATPVLVLEAVFAAGLVNRGTDLLVDRVLSNWKNNHLFTEADAGHVAARLTTISGVIRALKFTVISLIALVWVLSRLNVVPWSVVTLGAVIALAVSFAAQSLVKDVVVGTLILLEDQFVVGHYITVQDVTGTVEYMNLRITRLRTSEGHLVTLPNSSITKVENLSRSWTVIPVAFEVLPSANADAVLELVRRIAGEMAEEPAWKDSILNANEWSGVEKLTQTAMTLVIAIRTRPLKHWEAGRELRRRIKNALDTLNDRDAPEGAVREVTSPNRDIPY